MLSDFPCQEKSIALLYLVTITWRRYPRKNEAAAPPSGAGVVRQLQTQIATFTNATRISGSRESSTCAQAARRASSRARVSGIQRALCREGWLRCRAAAIEKAPNTRAFGAWSHRNRISARRALRGRSRFSTRLDDFAGGLRRSHCLRWGALDRTLSPSWCSSHRVPANTS